MDCKYVDTIYRGQSTFALWVGGMMHEMGHAFRLPHSNNYFPICGDFTKSPAFNFANYPTYRPSLMAIGNYTLEMYPTVLTKADCAMLNVNEIFNNDNIAYYENANSGLYTLHGVFKESSGVMEISGRYFNRPVTGNEISPIDDIVIYHDPNYNNEGFGGNRDYNALSWAIKPIGNDSFHINIPIQQLQFQNNTPYEIKIKLIHRNGKIKQTVAYFEFRNGRPNLRYHIRYDYAAISRNGWTINSSTSHPGLPASNLIDTNITSFWHSNYQTSPPASYPHTIDINLGQQKTLVGFGYTQRDDIARAIKDIRISVSTNGTDFSEIGNYILKKEEGLDFLSFPTPKTFQYFRLTALSSWDGFPFAALGELNLFETRAVNLPCSCD
jgi:hypothetical protein